MPRQYIRRANVASATALTLPEGANYFVVTGTTTITSISSLPLGTIITLRFSGALTLTYSATALILQGSVNLTTAAGDVVTLVSEGSGNWRETARRLATATLASPGITTPDINGGTADSLTSLSIRSTGAAYDLFLTTPSVFTANKTLTITPGDADRTITLSGNPTLADWFDQAVKAASNPTFSGGINLSGALITNSFEMVRGLLRESQIVSYSGWDDGTQIVSGSGAATLLPSRATLATGTTHASTAGVRDRLRLPGTAAAFSINWDKKFFIAFSLYPSVTDFTNLIYRVHLTQATTIGALAAHGLGIHCAGAAINLATYGTGGSEQLVDAATNLVNGDVVWVVIEHDPASEDRLYVNGVLKATQSTAASIPSTEPAASYSILPSISRSGGADVADEQISIYSILYGQDL